MTSFPSNLPVESNRDSSDAVKSFFDTYFIEAISFPAAQIDATIGFFEKRGFDKLASSSTAIVLLQQAKLDNVNVFDLLDTLKGLTEVQLSAVVTEVLNYNRQKTSTLGYRQEDKSELLEARNIVDNIPVVRTSAVVNKINSFDSITLTFDNNKLTFDQGTI